MVYESVKGGPNFSLTIGFSLIKPLIQRPPKQDYFGSVEGAFGALEGVDGVDGGQCPVKEPGQGDCTEAVNTCWSPGQRDIDCPNNGLCW